MHNSEIVKKFSFSSIFKYGEELLTSYVKPRNESCLPQRKGARLAFAMQVITFLVCNKLEDAKRSLMKIKCGAQESDCTFILAHHLPSKLAVSSFYKMDSGCKTQLFASPCQCGEHPSDRY